MRRKSDVKVKTTKMWGHVDFPGVVMSAYLDKETCKEEIRGGDCGCVPVRVLVTAIPKRKKAKAKR